MQTKKKKKGVYSMTFDTNNYDDILGFFPDKGIIIRVSEGTGDNLLEEDIEEEYTDYILYEVFDVNDFFTQEQIDSCDGGMIMYEEFVRDKFRNLKECLVSDVIKFVCGEVDKEVVILGVEGQ